MPRKLLLCLLASTLVPVARVHAAAASREQEEITDTIRLEDVTIRAKRDPRLEPALESAALEPVKSTLSAGELRVIQPASASDALEAAPYVHTETRGRKYKVFHSFRGQVYPYPDILFDGIWQREAREIFYIYPGPMIERVEIMRSPATLFHGLTDIVGAINLVPRKPIPAADTPPGFNAGFEAGRFGTARGYAFAEYPVDETAAVSLGGQYYRTDGRPGRNAAEEISSIFGSVVYEPDPDRLYELGWWFMSGSRELEMPDPGGPALNSLKNRRERYDPIFCSHVNLRGLHLWSERSTTDWRLFFSDRRARYESRKINPAGPGPGDSTVDENDREYGAQIIQGLGLAPANTLRLGLFLHRWTAPKGKQSYVGARQDVGSYALVLADEQKSGAWTFDAGIRYARSYFYDFTNPAFDITGQSTAARTVENEWDKHVLTGSAGAACQLNENQRLYAHLGIGERRPGPGVVRPDGGAPAAEKRYTADTGWETAWGRDGSGRFRVGAFGVWRNDAIVRINQTALDENGDEFYLSGNRDIRQHGLELECRSPGAWRERLFFTGALTWMRSEAESEGRYEKYREVPSLIVSAGVRLEAGGWEAALSAKHVDHYENFRFAQDGSYHDLGGYLDVGLFVGFSPGTARRIRIYCALDNLLDDEYATVVGWSAPGRSFRCGLETTF